MFKEIWKDVIGYEGLYQVSNHSNIKSLSRKMYNGKGFYISKEKILKPVINSNGYYHINLSKNNKTKTCTIHRLVATHFIQNPENKSFINHKDGNKLNNNINNLEWCTHLENVKHAWKNGLNENLRKAGKMNGSINGKKSCSKKVKCIELDKIFKSGREAERKTGISRSSISACCNNKQKSAGKHPDNKKIKLTWKYI